MELKKNGDVNYIWWLFVEFCSLQTKHSAHAAIGPVQEICTKMLVCVRMTASVACFYQDEAISIKPNFICLL